MKKLAEEIQSGRRLNRSDDLSQLLTADLEELRAGADTIRRELCGDRFDFCTIINGRSGRCGEDCKFCAQSAHYPVDTETYPLLVADELARRAAADGAKGVGRFSVVTSGRTLTDGETEALCLSLIHI